MMKSCFTCYHSNEGAPDTKKPRCKKCRRLSHWEAYNKDKDNKLFPDVEHCLHFLGNGPMTKPPGNTSGC